MADRCSAETIIIIIIIRREDTMDRVCCFQIDSIISVIIVNCICFLENIKLGNVSNMKKQNFE